METYLIKNGRVIDPANKLDKVTDILVKDGKIAEIKTGIKAAGAKVIDAKGKLVTPGLVDIHVHLREPGREDKETIETAMRAALKGGVTSLMSMPNTTPVTDNQTVVEYQLSRAKKLNLCHLYVSGTITRGVDHISEIRELKLTGAVALTDDGYDVQNEGVYLHAMEWAKTFDMPIFTHAEIDNLSGDGCMHEGIVSLELGLPGIPASAENLAIFKTLILAEEVGNRVHITHVSTRRGVELIREAKKRGVHVTAEATPHHFSLTHEECRGYNTDAKMYPPLREEEDRQAIIKGLKEGVLDIIATDHAPHLENEKFQPFYDAPKGTIGLETLFAATMTYLVRPKALTLSEAIEKMTSAPAKILNIPKGTLSKGVDADISIFDPDKKWTVDRNQFESKGKNCAFNNKTLYGSADTVFVSGELRVNKSKVL